mgnify:CR=1 FL=1
MKPTKPILLTILALLACYAAAYAAGEDITVTGDSKAKTVSLESAALPASGSEGEIRYNTTDDKLYVWDGAGWKLLSSNKNVATKIVAAYNSLDTIDKGATASPRYLNPRADYTCQNSADQNTINEAIDSLVDPLTTPANQKIPGVIYLLEGTYNLSGPIKFDNTGVNGSTDSGKALIGAGKGTTLRRSSGNFNLISASAVSSLLISQLNINGEYRSGDAISFVNVTNSKINKLWIEKIKTNGGAIYLKSSSNNIISHIMIKDSNSTNADGLELDNSSNNIISHSYISQCAENSIYIWANSSGNLIHDNMITTSGGSYGSVFLRSGYNMVYNNNIYANTNDGIWVDGPYSIIVGNNVHDNVTSGKGKGIVLDGYNSSSETYSNLISHNSIYNNSEEGISIEGNTNSNAGGRNIISGNSLYDNGGSGAYAGIKIDSTAGLAAGKNLITNNYIYDSAGSGYGINIATGDNNYLAANYITGSFPTKINDSGTNTKYTGKDKVTLEQVTDNTGNIRSDNSFVKLVSGVGSTLDNGKSSGDILIIQGPDSGTVTPTGTNLKLCSAHPNHDLGLNDTLILIWNATASAWLEVSYTNN